MTNLPRGWVATTLGQVAKLQGGATPKGVLTAAPGADIPFYKVSDMNSGDGRFMSEAKITVSTHTATNLSLRVVPPGSVIFPKVGGALRTNKKRVLTRSAAIDTNTMAAVPTSAIDARYLYYWLSSLKLANFAYGAPVPQVSRSRLSAEILALPPLTEQERIVAAIEEQFSRLDAGVAALESARQKLKRMRAAVLQAAVTGRLVDQDDSDGTADPLVARALTARDLARARAGRHRSIPLDYQHEHLPTLPHSWSWVSLDALADVVGGITKDAKKQTSPNLVEVPYLRVANVQRGYLDLRRVTTIKTTRDQVAALHLEAGDVLFNEGGDRDKLGRGWVWEGQIDPCIHQNHVFRARLYAPILDPRLLSWHGNTFGKRWFDRGGKQTTNLASVSKATLRAFPVPIPPLAEQRRIVATAESYLSIIEAIEVMVQADEQRAAALRTSILAGAFTGKLVSQDSDDEPASVLLDRIAADRVGSNGPMKAVAGRSRVQRQGISA